MGRPSKYPVELRERAVRMVAEIRPDYRSQWAAICQVTGKLGIGTPETLRTWIRRAEVDTGNRPGVTTEQAAEVARLKRENAELRRANEILKAAAIFFGAELDRAAISQIRLDTDGRVYHRRKRAEGKKSLEAIRCLKRGISDAIYRQLVEDAQRAAVEDVGTGPGGHCRATSESSAVDLPLHVDTSDQPLPGPANQTLRRTG